MTYLSLPVLVWLAKSNSQEVLGYYTQHNDIQYDAQKGLYMTLSLNDTDRN
jgi:hypothetical protein